MAITSFLNIFEVTPYMIVSEQDSETSLNRRKPRPPADAASIWIRFVDRNVSGAIGRCWHTLHGNFTPCGSHRLPPLPATAHIVEMNCTGSFPPAAKTHSLRHSSSSHKINDFVGALHDASTLGLRLDNRISPICVSSPPCQPRPVCARKAAPPIPPLLVGIMACSVPHGFPFGRISDVSNRPIQFPSCRQPARRHRCRSIRAEW